MKRASKKKTLKTVKTFFSPLRFLIYKYVIKSVKSIGVNVLD